MTSLNTERTWADRKAKDPALLAKKRARHQAHRDENLASQKVYRDAHREELRAYHAAYNQDHREARLAQARDYGATHREQKAASLARWRAANPNRNAEINRRWAETHAERTRIIRRAADIVHNEIRRGRLTKPANCEDCGSGGRIEASHEDYHKPLEIRWLCVRCHRRADANNAKTLKYLQEGPHDITS